MTTETREPEQGEPAVDPRTRALLLNDLTGMSRGAIGRLVEELTNRMGIDPSMAPIDLIEDKRANNGRGAIRIYINARGAAELAKRHDLSDDTLDVDIRDKVVIVKGAKRGPSGRVVRDVGAASFDPERPDTLARAIKAATTSCHRRTTLRMVGIFINEPESWDAVTDA